MAKQISRFISRDRVPHHPSPPPKTKQIPDPPKDSTQYYIVVVLEMIGISFFVPCHSLFLCFIIIFWMNSATRLASAFGRPSTFRPLRQLIALHNNHHHQSSRSRCFGSKVAEGNPPGDIAFYNEQDFLKDIDEDALCTTLRQIRQLIGYDTYDVTLILVNDAEMKRMNQESRGIPAPTDILSFPFHAATSPGTLEPVQFDIPDYYMLVRNPTPCAIHV